jgi:peptidoglycan/LPS O-acetylase OafA/YrhL
MLNTAIGFFALAAILGMLLLSYVLGDKKTPKGIALIHGPVAATGIILLLIYTFKQTPSPIESLILFVIAALGGIILFYRDIAGKSVPKWLAVAHGLIAVCGFLILLAFAFLPDLYHHIKL